MAQQTHECGNWDRGLAIPFPGIFVSNFRYCVFAVWHYTVDENLPAGAACPNPPAMRANRGRGVAGGNLPAGRRAGNLHPPAAAPGPAGAAGAG